MASLTVPQNKHQKHCICNLVGVVNSGLDLPSRALIICLGWSDCIPPAARTRFVGPKTMVCAFRLGREIPLPAPFWDVSQVSLVSPAARGFRSQCSSSVELFNYFFLPSFNSLLAVRSRTRYHLPKSQTNEPSTVNYSETSFKALH